MTKNEKLITMSAKEFSRYEIIQSFLDKKITVLAAALKIKVSKRQVYNMAKSVREKGVAGLIHKNRGRQSNRKIKDEVINEAIRYLKEKYSDFKPTFASEKLLENHNIGFSKEKVRQIMADEGLW